MNKILATQYCVLAISYRLQLSVFLSSSEEEKVLYSPF